MKRCCPDCTARTSWTGRGLAWTARRGGPWAVRKQTGPHPTDRGQPGSKHHVLTDAQGTPLSAILTGANRHDVTSAPGGLPLVDAVTPVRGQRRPRRQPQSACGGYADRPYDSRQHRQELRVRHIAPALARRGAEHGSGLGVYRWVVERTLGWLHQFRRLWVRYERRGAGHVDLQRLACRLFRHPLVQVQQRLVHTNTAPAPSPNQVRVANLTKHEEEQSNGNRSGHHR